MKVRQEEHGDFLVQFGGPALWPGLRPGMCLVRVLGPLAAPVFHAGVRALLGTDTTFQDRFFGHCQNKYLRYLGSLSGISTTSWEQPAPLAFPATEELLPLI